MRLFDDPRYLIWSPLVCVGSLAWLVALLLVGAVVLWTRERK